MEAAGFWPGRGCSNRLGPPTGETVRQRLTDVKVISPRTREENLHQMRNVRISMSYNQAGLSPLVVGGSLVYVEAHLAP